MVTKLAPATIFTNKGAVIINSKSLGSRECLPNKQNIFTSWSEHEVDALVHIFPAERESKDRIAFGTHCTEGMTLMTSPAADRKGNNCFPGGGRQAGAAAPATRHQQSLDTAPHHSPENQLRDSNMLSN